MVKTQLNTLNTVEARYFDIGKLEVPINFLTDSMVPAKPLIKCMYSTLFCLNLVKTKFQFGVHFIHYARRTYLEASSGLRIEFSVRILERSKYEAPLYFEFCSFQILLLI